MMADNELIPFGKYRGKPVETLAADKQYADWLSAQPWFRERYAGLYTIIINNFAPAEDTPAHNALQALFLDEAFRLAMLEAVTPEWPMVHLKTEIGWMHKDGARLDANDLKRLERLEKISDISAFSVGTTYLFEEKGVDVLILGIASFFHNSRRDFYSERLSIEIKPTVGDDFPTVLRQIKARQVNAISSEIPVLFLQEYIGVGVTQEQFIKIFEHEGIRVVFRDQVNPIPS